MSKLSDILEAKVLYGHKSPVPERFKFSIEEYFTTANRPNGVRIRDRYILKVQWGASVDIHADRLDRAKEAAIALLKYEMYNDLHKALLELKMLVLEADYEGSEKKINEVLDIVGK